MSLIDTSVKAISTAKITYSLADGQNFYKTPKAWEIWQEDPLARIKRIPRNRVMFVHTK